MNTLHYNGYLGSVNFSEQDGVFYGKIEGHLPLHKSYSGQLNIRIAPETHSRIAILAKQAGVTINSFIRSALDSRVAML